MEELERVVFNYLPRICNHCLNPSCLAACPSGAIYKRGEDGVVLVNEDKCRGWRMCVSGCPYKKVYYNWDSGKIREVHPVLPAPRDRPGARPVHTRASAGSGTWACCSTTPTRSRPTPRSPTIELLDAQLDMILDPHDPRVITAAKLEGIDDGWLDAAQRSPLYKFVKEWGMAFPLHPEYRTEAMMFYVPPLSPVMSTIENNLVKLDLPERASRFRVARRAREGTPAARVPGQPVHGRRRRADQAGPASRCWRCAPTSAARASTARSTS